MNSKRWKLVSLINKCLIYTILFVVGVIFVMVVNRTVKNTASSSHDYLSVQEAVERSDDFQIYRDVFTSTSQKLISSGRCRLNDFKAWGGWMRSTHHHSKPVYFTYCGGTHSSNRLYIDAETGKVFR